MIQQLLNKGRAGTDQERWLDAVLPHRFHLGNPCVPADASAAGPEPSVVERFEKRVRPVLAARCWRCHGPEQHKGGLRLDSADGVATGGESGPVVVAGKPEESRLIQAVRYAGDLKMPPKGRLSDSEAAELTEWVRTGPSGPRVEQHRGTRLRLPRTAKGPAAFWAFQAPRDPPLPRCRPSIGQDRRSTDSSWPHSSERGSPRHRRPASES